MYQCTLCYMKFCRLLKVLCSSHIVLFYWRHTIWYLLPYINVKMFRNCWMLKLSETWWSKKGSMDFHLFKSKLNQKNIKKVWIFIFILLDILFPQNVFEIITSTLNVEIHLEKKGNCSVCLLSYVLLTSSITQLPWCCWYFLLV